MPTLESRASRPRHHAHKAPAQHAHEAQRPSGEVQPDIVELHDQGDQPVHARRDEQADDHQRGGLDGERPLGDIGERDGEDLGREDEIGADRALDLGRFEMGRIAVPRRFRVFGAMAQQCLEDLLRALEAQEGAAEHEDGRDRDRQEGAEDQRRRQQDEQLVAQ